MSNTFTLDEIRSAATRKFCPLKIALEDGTEVELRGLIRLGGDEREIVTENIEIIRQLFEGSDEDLDEDSRELIKHALIDSIAAIAGKGRDRLMAELGDDFAVLEHVYETWMVESRLGEAASSPTS